MSLEADIIYRFDEYSLDVSQKRLLRGDVSVPITPKAFHTLLFFLQNAGRLIEKEEFMQELWNDRFVEDNNLTFNVKMLRRAIGDAAAHPRFIETVPRRGYRFIGQVTVVEPPPTKEARTEKRPLSRSFFRRAPVRTTPLLMLIPGAIVLAVWLMLTGNIREERSNPSLVAQNLSVSGGVFNTAMAPDGTKVVYTNLNPSGTTGVWLRDLETGSNVELIAEPNYAYFGLEFSADGGFIYIARRRTDVPGQADIVRFPLAGGTSELVAAGTQGWMATSRDGRSFAFVRCDYKPDNFCSVWMSDMAGGNQRRLVSVPSPNSIRDLDFSPDSMSIAFSTGQTFDGSTKFGISIVALDGSRVSDLTSEKFFDIKGLAWISEQTILATGSQIPNRSFRIWNVNTSDGSVKALTQDSESYAGLSLDHAGGRLVATKFRPDFNGQIMSIPELKVVSAIPLTTTLSLSGDKTVYFSSTRSGNDEIWASDENGQNERQLTSHLADDKHPLPDHAGDTIFFTSNRTGSTQIWRMARDGSKQTQITKVVGGRPLRVTPNGEWLYYHGSRTNHLLRVSTINAEEQTISTKWKYRYSVSGDGAMVAYVETVDGKKSIQIAALPSMETRMNLLLPDGMGELIELGWVNGSSSLLYILAGVDFRTNTLWSQSLQTGEAPRRLAEFNGQEISEAGGLSVAPDGQTFAVSQGRWLHDAVLLSGF